MAEELVTANMANLIFLNVREIYMHVNRKYLLALIRRFEVHSVEFVLELRNLTTQGVRHPCRSYDLFLGSCYLSAALGYVFHVRAGTLYSYVT